MHHLADTVSTLRQLSEHGCDLIRLDAFAYAVKKLDTNDFFVEPEIWDLLEKVQQQAAEFGTDILPKIHEHYSIQFKIAEHGYFVYDFALPMVTLYFLYSGKAERLVKWLQCPLLNKIIPLLQLCFRPLALRSD